MYIYLDIIEDFSCEMCGSCCLNDWLVTLDEDSYQRNAQLFMKTGRGEAFAQIFKRLIDKSGLGEYAYIEKKATGGCWFLDENNRCLLQVEAGHHHLDHVCQIFPRYPMNTARGTELTLSFSCPAVIRMASRIAPLTIIRSERNPITIPSNNDVVHVYPEQQPVWNPLRYYFELEQHFIDIMQCRSIQVWERLQMIKDTAQAINCLTRDQSLGQQITKVFVDNYELLDGKMTAEQELNYYIPDIVLENFFVNFIFKKPFYIYGLQPTIQLLENIWQRIKIARKVVTDPIVDMECTKSIIMEVEFEYSHNRRALFVHKERHG
ncbi:MAG: hypothetical protein H6Q68_538 [Firmicutes bacterium]|nr:hypothetical protein [Bacillota bacterium]